jgi:EcsC family protein
MNKIIKKQLQKLEKQESKFLENKNDFLQQNTSELLGKIEDKIPKKLRDTLNSAFYKGFQLVFEKGSGYIEKTYNKENIQLEHELNNYAINKKTSRKFLKRMDKQGNKSKLFNTSIATVEGSVLGLFGIGIPDIPIFISLLIRQLYEITLSYGYNYDTEEEKAYILLLICGAMTKGSEQISFNNKIEELGSRIDQNIIDEIDLKQQIKVTSNVLSEQLLLAKFIQGIPLIGVVGGAVNNKIISRTAKFAKIKYKKRYLLSKI